MKRFSWRSSHAATSVCGKCIRMDLKLNDLVALTYYFPVYGVIEDIGIVFLFWWSDFFKYIIWASIDWNRFL